MYPATFILVALGVACFLALGFVAFNRYFLSPIRNIPGPSFAAISGLWLWLHDINGSAPKAIKELHEKHGVIVRIGPNEVSIDDVDAHNSVLYCQAPKFMKLCYARYFYDAFKTGPTGSFQTADPQKHSILRRLSSKAFSKKSIIAFEPQIHETLNNLMDVLKRKCAQRESVELSRMTRCLSLDYITKFSYGDSLNAVKAQDFHEDILDAFDQFAISNFMFMMFPALRRPSIKILASIPLRVFQAIPEIRKGVQRALAEQQEAKEKGQELDFQPLLQAEQDASLTLNYPLSQAFLISHGVGAIFAGTDTTSTALTLTLLQIFSNEKIYERLHQELKDAEEADATTMKTLLKLELLPYLTACIKEGLRFSTPVRSRLPRVCPPTGWTYQGYFLPSGTIVSSSPYLLHRNEETFPHPEVFDPDRWLVSDPQALKKLDNSLAPFSKGARACTGINLAMAEIYITVATVIRRFKAVEKFDGMLKTRDIFGVIFDRPVTMRLEMTED